MLLRKIDEGVLAITQPAHAWLCGIMAQAWGNERFAGPQPRQALCNAAALHDIGWLDWEVQPDFDPKTGWPRVFADVPAEIHTRLWDRGVDHAGVYGLYAAVLVSMHGDTIYDKTFDAGTARPEAAVAVETFRRRQHDFQRHSCEALRRDPATRDDASQQRFAFNKKLIAALDTMSLHLCWGGEDRVSISDVPVKEGETVAIEMRPQGNRAVLLEPWPFSSPTLDLQIEGRKLLCRCATASDMAAELTKAERIIEQITLRPC